MLNFPPTPPDENHQPGYATPPGTSSLLTPDNTPPVLLKVQRDAARSVKMSKTQDAIPIISNESAEDVRLDSKVSGSAVMSYHAAYIPRDEMSTANHMQGRASDGSPEPLLFPSPQDLRIRKKRRHITRDQSTVTDPATTSPNDKMKHPDWSHVSHDTITTDNLYKEMRHSKMERIEAIEDGTAIEAMIVTAAGARRPSLRHVKKRHSLRLGSVNSSTPNNASALVQTKQSDEHGTAGLPDAGVRKVSPLRHKKAFAPARQEHTNVTVPVETASNPSVSSARTLRHERRPLSAHGRPQHDSQPVYIPLHDLAHDGLRHVSLPIQLKSTTNSNMQSGLRRVSRDKRLENSSPAIFPTEDEHITPHKSTNNNSIYSSGLSPSIKSHRLTRAQTPVSVMSDRTEMELCEAKNVTLFPHSNDSVLLVNSGSIALKTPSLTSQQLAPRTFRPLSFTFEDPEASSTTSSSSLTRSLSTPEIHVNGHPAPDSPLTNPRAAPLPPAIVFIPPTPSVDDERQAVLQPTPQNSTGPVQRSGSILRTARRLSGTILTPLFSRSPSYRYASRPTHISTAGNDRLHPMWTPNSMWDDDDDYTDDEDYDDDDDDLDRLPAGGDTSDHPTRTRRNLFPRQMSVRMPGFRGSGGFLLGNSLGVERHGTNSRRHHVELPVKGRPNAQVTFLQSVKRRMRLLSTSREEAARKQRRAELKSSIGRPDC